MAAKSSHSQNLFLTRALEKILSERELRRSQHQELRKACETALKEIKVELKKPSTSSSPEVLVVADKYYQPFELACRCSVPRITITALDCLQKLIANGALRGNQPDPDNPDKRLIDRIINTICSCFVGVQTDEGVELQIIKALLTILTAGTVEVHGATVLQAVRSCYNIFLASRNIINQVTAKACLTQILTTLYQKMELEVSGETAARNGSAVGSSDQPLTPADTTSTRHDSEVVDGKLEEVASELVERVLAKVVRETRERGEGEEGSGRADEDKPEDPHPITSSITHDDTSSLNQSDIVGTPSRNHQGGSGGHHFRSPLQKDCYMVFRSLCRLSMKGVSDIHDVRSHELRSKILSLELIASILQNGGEVFKAEEVFIGAVKQYLCVALSKNGVSSVPQVVELSLSIFLALFQTFKIHLKMQIEVFFKEIFLNILESATSSFQHKWLVLEALGRVCNDSQHVVDIYLNYDCDLSLFNIFEHVIGELSKIAQGRQPMELGATTHQEKMLRVKGLDCLVSILKCMVEWSRAHYIDPATTGLNTVRVIRADEKETAPGQSVANDVVDSGTGGDGDERGVAAGGWRHGSLSGKLGVGTGGGEGEVGARVEEFETRKKRKEKMQQGIQLFGTKPKKGVKFLQENGLLGDTPDNVAQLFHSDNRLDKAAVGDYLGESDDYCKAVMYAYIDQMDFTGMDFVAALRLLLSKFRLPGEAQKIDRLMEKFAGRYCETNTKLDIFASADAAYVLAYSIIMLTTDLHSSQVKKKMTKEEYIKMNRGINDHKDLPREYLEAIYDKIAMKEIKMSSQSVRRSTIGRSVMGVSEKQRRVIYQKEMLEASETAKALVEGMKNSASDFITATHVEHVKAMFKVSWTPFLAAFSVALRDGDDPEMVSLCLDGFRCAIRISCIFSLDLERDAYIKGLAKFTMLTTSVGLAEMKPKNIEVIKSLCNVAYTDGNYLQDSWMDVFHCVSQLELAQLVGTGVKTRYLTTSSSARPQRGGGAKGKISQSSRTGVDAVLTGTDQKRIDSIKEQVGETSSQTVVVAVDRIFTGSTRLDSQAIVDFVEALCATSNAELSNPTHPRMFSLQKIIEISYYNMDRIRLEWSRMWEVLGAHFNTVGGLPNEEVSFFVVDSLRQLSMKFLEKGELANFRFQKEFLRPFEHIMKRSGAVTIRDMVVRCVTQMVSSKAGNVR
ncbi:Brefeldin A-inhibited guanine nucleotide-exchange protein 2 [Geodia barretti]|nr:Brefeldin A-inhibited guanine nucleotide-exchange protein 2 [Geodia barretti]